MLNKIISVEEFEKSIDEKKLIDLLEQLDIIEPK